MVWPSYGRAKLVGLTFEEIEANPPSPGVWITNLVSSVVPIYVLAWLFVKLEVMTAGKGLMLGFLMALCFLTFQA